jgi:hypothetical protein
MEPFNTDHYYYATNLASPLSSLFNDIDSYNFSSGKDNDQYQTMLDQDLIYQDDLLSKLHEEAKGVLCMLLLPPSNMYRWHLDRHGHSNLNLINCTENKHTFYLAEKGQHSFSNYTPSIHSVKDLLPLVNIKVTAHRWCILNAQKLHAGINFDSKPKYMVQYVLKKKTSKLTYQEAVEFVKVYQNSINP